MHFRYGSTLAAAIFLTVLLAAPSRAQQQKPDVSQGWVERMKRLGRKYERFKERSRERVLAMADSLREVARANWAETKRLAQRDDVPLTFQTEKGYTAFLYDYDGSGSPRYLAAYGEASGKIARRPSNVKAAQVIGTDQIKAGSYNLTGYNQQIGLWEPGAPREDHQEFGLPGFSRMYWTDDSLRYQITGSKFDDTHATHVGGTMIGEGVISRAEGMAPEAEVRAYTTSENDNTADYSEMMSASNAFPNIELSNHSYGPHPGWEYVNGTTWVWYGDPSESPDEDWRFGFYGDRAKFFDEVAQSQPYYLIVKAAGNERNEGPSLQPVPHHLGSPNGPYITGVSRDVDCNSDHTTTTVGYDCIGGASVAKNVLTIGALQDDGTTLADFTAYGPTDDGRIKPDLMANGVELYSAAAYDDQGNPSTADYDTLSGTSMATPTVTGTVALLREFTDQNFPLGNAKFLSSTYKALLINTADDLLTSHLPGPDYRTGWGRVDAEQAADVLYDESQASGGGPLHIWEDTLNTGNTGSFTFSTHNRPDVRVTLAWTDPPGNPPLPNLDPLQKMLVNDLNVRIIRTSDGFEWKPFTLQPGFPDRQARPGDNARDNVEQIRVSNTSALETYRVEVTAEGSISGFGQPFSVVITENDNFNLVSDPGGGSGTSSLPGTIDTDMTLNGGEWKVDGTTVTGGATLTLEPGTTLKFRPNKRLIVEDGAGLLAEGTSTDKIRFKRNNASEPWDGVEVRGQGQPRVFEHVVFRGGDTERRALYSQAASVEVRHAKFINNYTGLYVGDTPSGAYGSVTVEDATFKNNTAIGLQVTPHAEVSVSNSTFRGNDYGLSAHGVPHECAIELDAADGSRSPNGGVPMPIRQCFDPVEVTNSTFKNNEVAGIYAEEVGLEASGSTFDGNGGAGITTMEGKAYIDANTIADNGNGGVFVYGSRVPIFTNNMVHGNGGEGVDVALTGFLYMNGESLNRIRYNDGHEVALSSSGDRVYLGNTAYDAGGYNDIYDASYGPGNHFVANGSSQEVKAENNYWGKDDPPGTGMFSGAVDYEPHLFIPNYALPLSVLISCYQGFTDVTCTANPTGGGGNYSYVWSPSNCGDTQSCSFACETDVQVTVTSATNESASAQINTGDCNSGFGRQTQTDAASRLGTPAPFGGVDRAALQGHIGEVMQVLEGQGRSPGSPAGNAQALHDLYRLLLLDAEVERTREEHATAVFGGGRASAWPLFTGRIQRVQSWGTADEVGDYANWPQARLAKQRAGEAAMLVAVENLLRAGASGEALAQAAGYAPYLAYARSRAELLLLKGSAYEHAGRYAEALQAVEAAEAISSADGLGSYTPPDLTPLKEHLQWLLEGSPTPRVAADASQGTSGQKAMTEGEPGSKGAASRALPQAFALGAPYPNPSSERVTLPLALPEGATVQAAVYDVLGRRVEALAEQSFSAGRPELDFRTRRLSSGLYLVRVHVETAAGETHVFSEKVTVVR